MANEEQLAKLRAGVEGWNQWRESAPDVAIDLSRANLGNAVLTGANLSGADLSRVNFIGATLSETNLSGVNLAGG